MDDNVLKMIQNKLPSFSKGKKRIAAYIIEECDKVAFMTAAKLGKTVGVSESTVVRFATELGFDGYPGMQNAIQQIVLDHKVALRSERDIDVIFGEQNLTADCIQADATQLHQMADALDTEAFSAAIEAIRNGKRVFLLGCRYFSPLVEYAGNYLHFLHRDVRVITTSDGRESLHKLYHVEAGDVAIVFGFSKDDSSSCMCSRYCRSRGATVIAVTDSQLSMLAQEGNIVLVAKTEMFSFVESLAGPMGLINALLSALGTGKEEEITGRLREMENFFLEFHTKEMQVDSH